MNARLKLLRLLTLLAVAASCLAFSPKGTNQAACVAARSVQKECIECYGGCFPWFNCAHPPPCDWSEEFGVCEPW